MFTTGAGGDWEWGSTIRRSPKSRSSVQWWQILNCPAPMCGNDPSPFCGRDTLNPRHSGRMRLSSWRRIVGRFALWMIKWRMLKILIATLQNHWCINCPHLLEKHSNHMIKKLLPELHFSPILVGEPALGFRAQERRWVQPCGDYEGFINIY